MIGGFFLGRSYKLDLYRFNGTICTEVSYQKKFIKPGPQHQCSGFFETVQLLLGFKLTQILSSATLKLPLPIIFGYKNFEVNDRGHWHPDIQQQAPDSSQQYAG